MLDVGSRIVVAGAGSIGCYVGGCLALAGRRVTLLLRPILADDIALHGLRISGFDGFERVLPASAFESSSEPQFALAAAQVLLVTVKSAATAEMAGLIAQYAPPDAIAVSFQNGIGNMEALAATSVQRARSLLVWCLSMSCRCATRDKRPTSIAPAVAQC